MWVKGTATTRPGPAVTIHIQGKALYEFHDGETKNEKVISFRNYTHGILSCEKHYQNFLIHVFHQRPLCKFQLLSKLCFNL